MFNRQPLCIFELHDHDRVQILGHIACIALEWYVCVSETAEPMIEMPFGE